VKRSLRSSMYSPFREGIQLRYRCIQVLLRVREGAVVVAKYCYLGISLRKTLTR
jgi:hypothetical protein